jgi:hypothetical protein
VDWGKQVVRRYRATAIQLTGGLIGSFLLLVVGLSTLAGPGRTGAGGIVIGILVAALACTLAASVITNMVTLTPDGITWRHNLRRKKIPWASVESFRVSRAPGMGNWSCLTADLKWQGSVQIKAIAGTRRYVELTLSEFEAFRAQLSPAAQPEGDSRR